MLHLSHWAAVGFCEYCSAADRLVAFEVCRTDARSLVLLGTAEHCYVPAAYLLSMLRTYLMVVRAEAPTSRYCQ